MQVKIQSYSYLIKLILDNACWTEVNAEYLVSVSDLVKVAGPPDGPDLLRVVEEAEAGLRQPVALPDPNVPEATHKLPPHVGPQTAARRQPHAVSTLLWNLEGLK